MAITDSFWTGFFLVLIFLPLTFLWAFTLIDIFMRDMSGWAKALWVLAVLLLPLLGMLAYFIVRPVTKEDEAAQEEYIREREFDKAATAADKLHKLSELRDKGDITQEESKKKKGNLI